MPWAPRNGSAPLPTKSVGRRGNRGATDVDADAVKLGVACTLICTLSVGCERRERAITTGANQSTQSALPSDLSIELDREWCYGSCPTYAVTIDVNGVVRWDGRTFVDAHGAQTAQVPTEVVRELAAKFDSIEFTKLHDHYDVTCTDIPSARLTLSARGRVKTVSVRGAEMLGEGVMLLITDDVESKDDPSSQVPMTEDGFDVWQERMHDEHDATYRALDALCDAIDKAAGTARWIGSAPDEKRR